MAASIAIEIESGVYTKNFHPHNGYYAGSFSRLPASEQPISHDDANVAA
jgi:hypothetical protein